MVSARSRRRIAAVAVAVVVAVIGGAGGLAHPIAGHAATAIDGVPRYDHIFTIVLENENFDAAWNTPGPHGPTYLQSLRSQGAFASEYQGISHVSADNYIAMTSGQPATPFFNTDCMSWALCEGTEKAWPDGGRSIADQVEDSGMTWRAYMESMATSCQHPDATTNPDPYQTGYATRHNPFVYYPPIVENTARCNSHVVSYTHLATDLTSEATTPNYVFITPDTCHDGHDAPCSAPEAGQPGGLTSANAWLSVEVPKILHSPAFTTHGVRSLLLITFDENGFSDVAGCCGLLAAGAGPTTNLLAFGGRVGLVAVGAGIKPGKVINTPYDHWSYLRTAEDTLGIGEHLNMSGLPTTKAMTDLFG
jgi:phosphatidylinositol-3-phosphatase